MLKTIKSELLTVQISPVGAEIKSVKAADGTEFIWEADPDIWGSSAPILFPICGGLKNDRYTYLGKEYTLSKHGFVTNAVFEIEEITQNSICMLYKSNPETLVSYPFDFEFRAIFTVISNSLSVTYSVKNLTDGNMYFSVGAHEGYMTPEGIEEYEIIFDDVKTLDSYGVEGNLISNKAERIVTNSNILPLKEDYFKIDALIFKGHNSKSCTLSHRNGARKITVECENFANLLFWHKPYSNFLCIEPWNGMADIVGSSYDITEKEGIICLLQGGDYSVSRKITFSA